MKLHMKLLFYVFFIFIGVRYKKNVGVRNTEIEMAWRAQTRSCVGVRTSISTILSRTPSRYKKEINNEVGGKSHFSKERPHKCSKAFNRFLTVLSLCSIDYC